jgi:hypothetical protein
MTDAGVVIIFLWFGVGALLFAAIPGLVLGLPIGMFLKRRDLRFLVCFSVSLIGTFITCWWWIRQPNAFDPVTFSVILGALLITTSIGAWLGRKLAVASDTAH